MGDQHRLHNVLHCEVVRGRGVTLDIFHKPKRYHINFENSCEGEESWLGKGWYYIVIHLTRFTQTGTEGTETLHFQMCSVKLANS